jgi:hypothetical protein
MKFLIKYVNERNTQKISLRFRALNFFGVIGKIIFVLAMKTCEIRFLKS